MKKLLFSLLLSSQFAMAGTYTPHYSLYKPIAGDIDYVTPFANSMDTIDNALYGFSLGISTVAGAHVVLDNSTNTFISSTTFKNQVYVSSNIIVIGSGTFNSVYATNFYGAGNNLTGVIYSTATGTYPLSISGISASGTANVLKAGDTMTGPLTMSQSSITITNTSSILGIHHSAAGGTGDLRFIYGGDNSAWVLSHVGGSEIYADSLVLRPAIGGFPLQTWSIGGNVGIGQTLPEYKLHVEGGIYASSSMTATNFYGALVGNASSATYAVTTSSDAYWNAKQAAGDYITALTGNVTASGPGSVAATIVSVPPAAVDLSTVTTAINLKVSKSGDTMTGPLTLTGAGSYVTTASSMSAASAVIGGVTLNGNVTSTGTFYGSGAGLTALNAANVSGALTASSVTVNGDLGIAKTYKLAMASATINTAYDVGFSSASEYWLALQSTTTLTFSSVEVGDEMVFYIEQSSNSKGITWPAAVDWGTAGAVILSTTTRYVDTVAIKCQSSAHCFGWGTKNGFTAP